MIRGNSVLGIIPARGGSKGIPRKNLVDLGGKPLIAWTIEAATASQTLDRLILSSEDDEIIATALEFGCEVPFVRPASLAQDETAGAEPVIHALDALEATYSHVVLLQPTSPFRSVEDIDSCVKDCIESGAPACVSVTEAHAHPYLTYGLDEGRVLHPLVQPRLVTRRQDLPPAYVLNGAVYVARAQWFRDTRTFLTEATLGHVMPAERSVDVDTQFDLRVARALLR